ncbi:hypothetical protein QR680_013590 [Steinernema hermaphroditum]|uniref:3'-5' exonuclease domain-containing protein n=1 Tax=Steinernema hermaphroditum TaxID=289476 RepID=A0AA39I617_9BILA|nr:hypothetical protein QR680_013590 [Steinernema hermaphroditum]
MANTALLEVSWRRPRTSKELDIKMRRLHLFDDGTVKEMFTFETPLKTVNCEKPKEYDRKDVRMVTTRKGIQELLRMLCKETEIAVDVEFYTATGNRPHTALIQMSTRTQTYIIDSLTLGTAIQPLQAIFANENIVKVFHGSGDITALKRDFGFHTNNFFDTQKVAQTMGLPDSLFGLVKKYCGLELNKTKGHNWKVRPLPTENIDYAAQDTHYLLYCADRLRKEAEDRRRRRGSLRATSLRYIQEALGGVTQFFCNVLLLLVVRFTSGEQIQKPGIVPQVNSKIAEIAEKVGMTLYDLMAFESRKRITTAVNNRREGHMFFIQATKKITNGVVREVEDWLWKRSQLGRDQNLKIEFLSSRLSYADYEYEAIVGVNGGHMATELVKEETNREAEPEKVTVEKEPGVRRSSHGSLDEEENLDYKNLIDIEVSGSDGWTIDLQDLTVFEMKPEEGDLEIESSDLIDFESKSVEEFTRRKKLLKLISETEYQLHVSSSPEEEGADEVIVALDDDPEDPREDNDDAEQRRLQEEILAEFVLPISKSTEEKGNLISFDEADDSVLRKTVSGGDAIDLGNVALDFLSDLQGKTSSVADVDFLIVDEKDVSIDSGIGESDDLIKFYDNSLCC